MKLKTIKGYKLTLNPFLRKILVLQILSIFGWKMFFFKFFHFSHIFLNLASVCVLVCKIYHCRKICPAMTSNFYIFLPICPAISCPKNVLYCPSSSYVFNFKIWQTPCHVTLLWHHQLLNRTLSQECKHTVNCGKCAHWRIFFKGKFWGAHIWAGRIFGGIFVSHLWKIIIKVVLKICKHGS